MQKTSDQYIENSAYMYLALYEKNIHVIPYTSNVHLR